jgi:hypothetical protein
MKKKELSERVLSLLLMMSCISSSGTAVAAGVYSSVFSPGIITDTKVDVPDSTAQDKKILFDDAGVYTISNGNGNKLTINSGSTGIFRVNNGEEITINGNIEINQQGLSHVYWSGHNQVEAGGKLIINGDFVWNQKWAGTNWNSLRENFNIKGNADFNGNVVMINDVDTIGPTTSQTTLNILGGTTNINGDLYVYNRVGNMISSGTNAVYANNFGTKLNILGNETTIIAVSNEPDAISAKRGATVNIESAKINVVGSMDVAALGTINATFSGADSYWYGDEKNTVGTLNLTFKDGAEWGYFGGDTHYAQGKGISAIALENGGIINLYDDYLNKKLDDYGINVAFPTITNVKHDYVYIGDLKGQDGIFQLDLNSTDKSQSDMIYILDSSAGTGVHSIQSYAADSFAGISANNTLRFATVGAAAADKISFKDSENIYGKSLWDYKLLIGSEDYDINDPENALYNDKANGNNYVDGVLGTGAKNWFIYGYEKTPTVNAQSFIAGNNVMYAAWINSNNTLRNRLGELDYKNDNHGMWARIYEGKLKGDAFSNNYQTYQIGYDATFADKTGKQDGVWYGGAAFEYTKGSSSYTAGSGDLDMGVVSLYATKKGKYGDNVDLVLKHGKIKGEVETFGRITDSGDFDTKGTSLSVEYNKRMNQDDGIFIEPQAQLTLGHINGNKYTTKNGTRVEYDGIDSAVARLGIVVGKDFDKGNVYLKASALHEFGGKGAVEMSAADGAFLRESKNYNGSWFELGLGTNWQTSKNSHVYLDVERSFNGAFEKQWQINAGMNWTF